MRGQIPYWRVLAALGVIVGLVSFSIYIDKPDFRYRHIACQGALIHERSEPIDYVAIGSSRAQRAFKPTEFAATIERLTGTRPTAYNLARGQRGMGQTYSMLLDLIEYRRVQHIVLEFNSSRRANMYFASAARNSVILTDFFSYSSAPLMYRVKNSLSELSERYTSAMGDLFKYEPEDSRPPDHMADSIQGNRCGRPYDPIANQALYTKLKKIRDKKKTLRKPDLNVDQVDQDRNRYYTRKIIELAQKNGIEIYMIYLPPFTGLPLSDEDKQKFQETFGHSIISMNAQELADLYRVTTHFRDRNHMSQEGSRIFTRWLAGQIAGNS